MSSHGSHRKRHHRSKAGTNHKHATSENVNQRAREIASQQQQQQTQQQEQQHPQQQKQQQQILDGKIQTDDGKCLQTQLNRQTVSRQQQKQKQDPQQQRQQQQAKLLSQIPVSGIEENATNSQNPHADNTQTTVGHGKKKNKNNQSEQDDVSLHTAVFCGRKDLVETLLKRGSNPCQTDQQGNNVLMTTCKMGNVEMMSSLWNTLEAESLQFNLAHANKDGDTALHICAFAGNEDGCRLLISKHCSVSIKNKEGETALHLAAKFDHVTICNMLLEAANGDSSGVQGLVLEENERGQTAICISILHQYAQIVGVLLDTLDPEMQATYLENRFRKVLNESQQICYNTIEPSAQHAREVFLRGLLICVSVLMIRLTKKSKQLSKIITESGQHSRLDSCLSKTDIIEILVRISCSQYAINQILPIACFLLVYLIEGVSEEIENRSSDIKDIIATENRNLTPERNRKSQAANHFFQQFVNCDGPNNLLLKISEIEINETSDAMITLALALPVLSLIRSKSGRSWLENNRSHLTFLKEVVLQKRTMLDVLTNACPLLLSRTHLDTLCGDFVTFIETMEAKDREQNLAELLLEEERDRKRRERKRRKNKKQILVTEIKSNEEIISTELLEVSSEDDFADCTESHVKGHSVEASKIPNSFASIVGCGPNRKGTRSMSLGVSDAKQDKMSLQETNTSDYDTFAQNKILLNRASKNTIINARYSCDLNARNFMQLGSKQGKEDIRAGNNSPRWADVAKIGSAAMGREMKDSKIVSNRSKLFSNRAISCEWPLSISENKDKLLPGSKMNDLRHIAVPTETREFKTSWCNDNLPYLIDDPNSDEDSSSTSSSSSTSPSSMVSDSFHCIDNPPLLVESCEESVGNGEKLPMNNIPLTSHKQTLKRKNVKTQKDNATKSRRNPSFDDVIGISISRKTCDNHQNEVTHLPILSDSLVRTWSDNIINLPKFITGENTALLGSKNEGIAQFSKFPSHRLMESNSKMVKPEQNSPTPTLHVEETGWKSTAQLSVEQKKVNLLNNSKDANVSLQCTGLSQSLDTNTRPSSALSINSSTATRSSLKVESISVHPPPPGFNSFHLTGSLHKATDAEVNKNTTALQNRQSIDSSSLTHTKVKRRIVSPIFLGNVVNLPSSGVQKTSIPSLSSLAWKSCGHDSILPWSDLKNSKPITGHITSNCTPTLSLAGSLNPLDNITGDNKNNEVIDAVKRTTESNLNIGQPFTSFSTTLMNRMKQRSHRRNETQVQSKDNEGIPFYNSTLINSVLVQNSPLNDQENPNAKNVYTVVSGTNTREADHIVSDRNCGNCLSQTLPDNSPIGNQQRQDTGQTCVSNTTTINPQNVQGLDSDQSGRITITEKRSQSPPVLFPDKIRGESNMTTPIASNFPSFHDGQTSDFLSEMFSDPLFTDNIAMNQIRQKITSSNSTHHTPQDVSNQSLESSEVDLDYYASIYQMKFRDVLSNRTANFSATQSNSFMNKSNVFKDSRDRAINQNVFGLPPIQNQQLDNSQQRRHSLRWNRSIQKLLDLLWTTRQQHGNIILPNSVAECSIGMVGNALILIGFLGDGSEVAVFVLDKSLTHVLSRLVEVMSNPDVERYFLMQCKSFSEHSNIQYIAVDLYEFALCEYLQLYLPSCNHNQEIYTLLVWQLFQAIAFLHLKLSLPHGCLAPNWIFINKDGNLRLAIFGATPSQTEKNKQLDDQCNLEVPNVDHRHPWQQTEDQVDNRPIPSFYNDVYSAGKVACFILTKGQHLFGMAHPETEMNFLRDHISCEAFDLISPMLGADPKSYPTIDQCLKHPIFWSVEKKFRLILIVGSDVLTEMKTGVALTGTGAPTMMEILSLIDINIVSPNWIHEVDSTVLKEMRSFRVYKNNLAELTLFVYNCCLHFDKLSNIAKEVLDDPCKYFQNLFPGLFMAIFRSLKSSDRIDRTCYKPFF